MRSASGGVRRIDAAPIVRTSNVAGESPRWDVDAGVIRWVDIPRRALHACGPDGGAHASVATERMVGAIVPATDGWSAAAEGGFYGIDVDTGALDLLAAVDDGPRMRMNDGACDPAGRFWAGSMALDARLGAGTLWCLSGSDVRPCLRDLTIPNGLDWSPDATRMYYVDSTTHRVDVFDFDVDTGSMTSGRAFAAVDDGLPDGLTVDADGCVWVAVWGAGEVRCFDPRGDLIAIVGVPTPQVTSCAFGGASLDRLFVTTAALGLDRTEEELAGALFACEPGVIGRAPARHHVSS